MPKRHTISKRMFDLTLAICLVGPVSVICLGLAIWLLIRQGRPVFFVSERIGANGGPFRLWKFRTMDVALDGGVATGGDKAARITGPGQWMRACRLDELPQLWNILRGELSFVGPRPPLRRYVHRHPEIYDRVLRSRPGLTGLATLIYHQEEARILGPLTSAAQTDLIYSKRIVPRKARLDLIYQRHASIWFDIAILWRTVWRRRLRR